MNVEPEIVYGIGFGLWAGVLGLSVRAVLSRLDDLARRMLALEVKVARVEAIEERRAT